MAKYNGYGVEEINGIPYYGGYISSDSDDNFVPAGLAVWVEDYAHIFDKDQYCMELRFLESATTGKTRNCSFFPEEFSKRTCSQYAAKGIHVTESTASVFENYVHAAARELPVSYRHAFVGWDTNENTKDEDDPKRIFFKHYTAKVAQSTKSEYIGDYPIKPKGSWKNWLNGVKEHVLGYLPLEAALCIGLSSVMVGYQSVRGNPGTLLFHFAGDSSIGKTTACMLAISTAASPESTQDSKSTPLMTTWANTRNSIFGLLRGNCGIPVCLDELGSSSETKLNEVIYALSGGKERTRMKRDASGLRESYTWSTVLLSNGELRIQDRMSEDPNGVRVRCYQFNSKPKILVNGEPTPVKWTKSADNSDSIKEFVRKNYGFAAPKFAKLIRNHKNDLDEWLKECTSYYASHRGIADGLTDRRASSIGLVLLTAKLLEIGMDIPINWKELADFFILNEKDQDNECRRVYEYLCSLPATHPSKFINTTGKDNQPLAGTLWGYTKKVDKIFQPKRKKRTPTSGKKVIQEIWIYKSAFEEVLKGVKAPNADRVLEQLRENGLLDCEVGKFATTKKDIHGISRSYYVIPVFKD